MLIRKALMELLRQKPIQAISIKELCESAGINRGTFYAHYTDMYDLLQKIESDMLQDFQEALKPLLAPNRSDLTPRHSQAPNNFCRYSWSLYLDF